MMPASGYNHFDQTRGTFPWKCTLGGEHGMAGVRRALTLEEIARRLDGAGIVWAVFAGAAATAYGATRPLTDVDILVSAAEGERVAALFPEAEIDRFQDSIRAILLPGFDLLAGLHLMDLDLDTEMAQRLTFHEIAGVSVPVIPPEDNILLKAMWGRGPEQGKHDWEDVEAMMANLPALDWDYLRWRARTLDAAQQAGQAVKRLDALWRERGRASNAERKSMEVS
jgi:hypothetical protein